MNAPIQLIDLTAVHVTREMYRADSDPLADPTFKRHVSEVATETAREAQADRLWKVRRAA